MGLGPDPLLVKIAEEIFRELERTPGVEQLAFVGALARNMYAAPRATGDVDISIRLQDEAAYQRVVKRLARLKYQLHQEPGPAGGVLPDSAHFDGPVHLDLLIAHTPFERQALENRRVFGKGNEVLAAVRPEDLVVYKLIPFRGHDQGDIADVIEKVIESGEEFDWEAVERYAKDFGVGDRVEWARSVDRKYRKGQ
jgi:predicted nucleotidyltransferase